MAANDSAPQWPTDEQEKIVGETIEKAEKEIVGPDEKDSKAKDEISARLKAQEDDSKKIEGDAERKLEEALNEISDDPNEEATKKINEAIDAADESTSGTPEEANGMLANFFKGMSSTMANTLITSVTEPNRDENGEVVPLSGLMVKLYIFILSMLQAYSGDSWYDDLDKGQKEVLSKKFGITKKTGEGDNAGNEILVFEKPTDPDWMPDDVPITNTDTDTDADTGSDTGSDTDSNAKDNADTSQDS